MRQAPPESATEFAVGTIRKGNDGGTWVVATTSSGVHRWVRVRERGGKDKDKGRGQEARAVRVVDNGAVCFLVEADRRSSKVLIRVNVSDDDGTDVFEDWKSISFERMLVGYDPGIEDEDGTLHKPSLLERLFRREPPWWRGGNGVLLEVREGRYVMVVAEIVEFDTVDKERILRFVSPMGNSGVPYPYAVGGTHTYVYHMSEGKRAVVAVRNDFLERLSRACQSKSKSKSESQDLCTDPYFLTTWVSEDGKAVGIRKRDAMAKDPRRGSTLKHVRTLHDRVW